MSQIHMSSKISTIDKHTWTGVFNQFRDAIHDIATVKLINQSYIDEQRFFKQHTEFSKTNVNINNAILSSKVVLHLDCKEIEVKHQSVYDFKFEYLSIIQVVENIQRVIIKPTVLPNKFTFIMMDHPTFTIPPIHERIFGYASSLNANTIKHPNGTKLLLAFKDGTVEYLNQSKIDGFKNNKYNRDAFYSRLMILISDMLTSVLEQSGILNEAFINHWFKSLVNSVDAFLQSTAGLTSLPNSSGQNRQYMESLQARINNKFATLRKTELAKKATLKETSKEPIINIYLENINKIIHEYKSYSIDLVKMMTFPYMIDLNEEPIKALDRMVSKIQLRLDNDLIVDEDIYLDLNQAYSNALRQAETKKLSMFDNSQRQTIKDAKTMYDKAINEESTDTEKRSSIRGIQSSLENVLPLNSDVMHHLHKIAGLREIEQ